jgi:hypothetical protein
MIYQPVSLARVPDGGIFLESITTSYHQVPAPQDKVQAVVQRRRSSPTRLIASWLRKRSRAEIRQNSLRVIRTPSPILYLNCEGPRLLLPIELHHKSIARPAVVVGLVTVGDSGEFWNCLRRQP